MSPFPSQRPGDRHAGQLDFHCAAALPGWRDGLGHDSSGDRGHWIRSVISVRSWSQSELVFRVVIGAFFNIACSNFPLLHGVRQPERGAGRRRHYHWPGPTDRLLHLPADQTDVAGFQYVLTPTHAHVHMACLWFKLPPFLVFDSDHPRYRGAHHHPATHLPPEETAHRHCTHQRGQQVSCSPGRAARFFYLAKQLFSSCWDAEITETSCGLRCYKAITTTRTSILYFLFFWGEVW